MKCSPWKTASLAYATDDDLTPEVDLGYPYDFLTVIIPTIESSTVTVHVAQKSGGTFQALHEFDDDATGSFAHATTAGTGGITVAFRIPHMQYVKIALGTGQTANRDFIIQGWSN